MGTWIALTTCCVVACVSSTRVWRSIASFREYKIGQHYRDDDEYEMNVEDDAWAIITADDDNPIEFLPVMFLRTKISVAMGLGGAALGIMAILAHWYEGYGYYKNNSFHYNFGDDDDTTAHKRPYNVALLFELFVGVCTTALFGIGGWFVTGSGGPAQSVGNLYYATMITFLLSLRVVVGCVEELIEAHEVHDGIEEEFELQKIASFGLQNFSNDDGTYVTMNDGDNASIMLPPTTDMTNYRPGDLRKWGAIAMFSSVNLGSVIDGIYNMDFSPPDDDAALAEWTGGLDKDLQWMILAPSIAITVSSVFFLLCLFPQSYSFISKYRFSTPAAILTFACWCSNLIVTMHSHSSLAVNGRGEIITANQYYFSWASCSTSFLNMLGYLRRGEPESVLAILWSAILKISLVMVSASVHVWGNIKDECLDEDGAMIMDNASHQNFCQRTRFSLTAAYVGTVISLAALVLRIWVFRCFAILELVASVVMMGLFTYGTYYVTSIDGPGQVVGDLYYATWIVLICSLVIGESCWEQFSEMFLKKPEVNDFNVAGSPSKESEETTSTSSSQFVAAQLTTF